ncbi:hypothetical protein BGZ51_001412 [Haplosporangium sp. Z 767]|nr:hypothetical protein BGZ51_001412 [Haplosporangium sp. Z 767]KAF9188931.1 hypothetical protein BGZ50_001081 [Haplosporangium sp. Z 11]
MMLTSGESVNMDRELSGPKPVTSQNTRNMLTRESWTTSDFTDYSRQFSSFTGSSPTDEDWNVLATGASDAARFLSWFMVEYQYQSTVYQLDVELSVDIALDSPQTQKLIMSNAQDAHIY